MLLSICSSIVRMLITEWSDLGPSPAPQRVSDARRLAAGAQTSERAFAPAAIPLRTPLVRWPARSPK